MFNARDLLTFNEAHEIAFLAHTETGATRGGMGNLPYYIHVVQVAGEVLKVVLAMPPIFTHPYTYLDILSAAVLHDVPEDCDPKWLVDIRNLGGGILELSLMLKNAHLELPEDQQRALTRQEKKRMDLEKMADPNRFHVCCVPTKYKDRLHNLRTSVHWDKRRQLRYAVEETPALIEVLDKRMGSFPNDIVQEANREMKEELYAAIEEVKERVK